MTRRLLATLACAAVVASLRCSAGQSPPAPPPPPPPPIETFPLKSDVFHNRRTIRVLPPIGYRDRSNRNRRYPVLYLNDGFAVFKAGAWNAPAIVTRLESEGRIQPILLVGIDNGASAVGGTPDQRTIEYVPYGDEQLESSVTSPRGFEYPDFLIKEVMPAVAARYRVLPGAEGIGLGGASYGGLAALYTVMHRPGVIGRLLIESTPLFLREHAALNEANGISQWPARVSIGVGTRETEEEEIAKAAAAEMEALRAAIRRGSPGTAVQLVVEPEGTHGPAAWRRRLPAALEFLWPANPSP